MNGFTIGFANPLQSGVIHRLPSRSDTCCGTCGGARSRPHGATGAAPCYRSHRVHVSLWAGAPICSSIVRHLISSVHVVGPISSSKYWVRVASKTRIRASSDREYSRAIAYRVNTSYIAGVRFTVSLSGFSPPMSLSPGSLGMPSKSSRSPL